MAHGGGVLGQETMQSLAQLLGSELGLAAHRGGQVDPKVIPVAGFNVSYVPPGDLMTQHRQLVGRNGVAD